MIKEFMLTVIATGLLIWSIVMIANMLDKGEMMRENLPYAIFIVVAIAFSLTLLIGEVIVSVS